MTSALSAINRFAKNWLPPIVTKMLQKWRGGGNRFDGDFQSWEAASARCTGYDAEHILAKVLEATLKVKRGEAAFERDSVLFDEIEYVWPVTAGLMWAAASNGGKLHVLDFGGALGSSYFQNRKLLEDLPEVRWNVVEQAHYVDAGQKYIQDKSLRFYPSIDACLDEMKPDVILLSSVLQYIKNPFELLKEAMNTGARYIIIDRTPFSRGNIDRLCLQYVSAEIFESTLACWIFSSEKIVQTLSREFELIFGLSNDNQLDGVDINLMGGLWRRRVLLS